MRRFDLTGMAVLVLLSGTLLFPVRGSASPFDSPQGNHSKHHQMSHQSASLQAKAVDVNLHDLELVDKHGNPVFFVSDVVKDRLVAINFVYTTCKNVCPIQSSIFESLQEQLKDRSKQDVFLISITIDPLVDVPDRLQEYSAKYQAGPGWIWLTGKKENVDQVLLGLGAYSSDVFEHQNTILVGDGLHGRWTRFYGFPNIGQLTSKFMELEVYRKNQVKQTPGVIVPGSFSH